MPYFKDADEVYAYIGRLFEELADDDELAPKFRKANTTSSASTASPSRRSRSNWSRARMARSTKARRPLEPEVGMTMDADTAHRFWLGKVNVTVALARGQMKAAVRWRRSSSWCRSSSRSSRATARSEQADRKDLLEAA